MKYLPLVPRAELHPVGPGLAQLCLQSRTLNHCFCIVARTQVDLDKLAIAELEFALFSLQ